MKKNAFIYTILVFSLIQLFCAKFNENNPYLSNFSGDYALGVHWERANEALVVFKPYVLHFTSTGRDTFADYNISADTQSVLDTTLSHVSRNDSTISVYFVKPFTGLLHATGIHPNGKVTEASLDIKVTNPFRVQGTTSYAAGQTITLSVSNDIDSSFQYRWYVENAVRRDFMRSPAFSFKSDSVCNLKVFADVKDRYGHIIPTDTVTVAFNPRTPVVKFPQENLEVPVGQEITIAVQSSDCDSIQWVMKQAGVNTTKTGPLSHTFTLATTDTVIATGISRYGIRGQPDTLFISAAVFTYTLKPDTGQFPDTIRVKQWATWKISVLKNDSMQTGPDIVYQWIVSPDSSWDSLKLNGDGSELSLYFSDSIPSLLLRVRAKVGKFDSTYWYNQTVVTRVYRPSSSFVTSDFSTPIYADNPVTIKAEDSNSGGNITAIYYTTSDNAVPVSTNNLKTWSIRFLSPGQKTVKCWVVDNDGFFSDTSVLRVSVTANHPYFVPSQVDTVGYINHSLRVTMHAYPGNNLDTIKSYRWDTDNNGIWDRTAQVSFFDTTFTTTGIRTFRVGCIDSRGDTGTAVVRVNVTIGKPVVKGISPDSCWIADQVSYTVRTSAPVGKVVRWGIKWEGGSSFEESSDSTFTHAYPASGRKALLAYAVNDENVSSDTVGDSVIVKPGLPSVTVIATSEPMSALYIKDQVRYTIKGQDQNDYIDSILVSWNGDTVFEELIQAKGDSAAVTHAFAREDSGSRQIRFRAKDPDGIVDDSVLNVSVLSGAPVVDSLTPRTVWVNDNNPVVIHSSDTNGYVVKRWVDWDRNGTWDDSLTKNDQNTHISIDTFYHAWDTAFGGKFATYWVRIMDEDSVMSAVKTCTIFVRMGRPVLKGGASYGLPIQWKADTMFYIYTGGNPSFAVDTIDTNGVIQKFYWDIGRDGINDSTAVPFWSQYVPPNMATPFRITSKDDDGLKSLAFDFVVFPDAPPDTPLVYNEVPFGDSVTLRWSRYDLKDGKDATLFGIKIDYVGNNPTNLLIEQTGSKFGWDGTRYTYKFKPSNPSFSYRIYAKDARGSVTESLVQYYAP